MSERAVKFQRREIRRAYGSVALATLSDTQQSIATLGQSLREAHERIDALTLSCRAHWTATDRAQQRLFARAAVEDHRTVWQRVRWLVTGS